jgi:hypothetical protein
MLVLIAAVRIFRWGGVPVCSALSIVRRKGERVRKETMLLFVDTGSNLPLVMDGDMLTLLLTHRGQKLWHLP